MNKLLLPIVLFIFAQTLCAQTPNAISAGIRTKINSEILGEIRSYQVYLPPSYYVYPSSTYPVLYLIDGDYNFHYVTGLVELMCDISEEIPEIIVVGVSDGGSKRYAEQCNPGIGESAGKGNDLIAFFEKELMPSINKSYRTSGFDILQGHSRGGLFTTYAALEKPELFDVYHAISPALWWQDYALLEHAKSKLTDQKVLPFRMFMTLANEKEMGVNRFAKFINDNFPETDNYQYTLLLDENHGSVGLPSMQIMFKALFGKYKMTRDQFKELDSPEAFVDNYIQLQNEFFYEQPLPANRIGDAAHYYFSRDRQEELTRLKEAIKTKSKFSLALFNYYLGSFHEGKENYVEASKYYHLGIYVNSKMYENFLGAAGLAKKEGHKEKAIKLYNQALAIAKNTKARQWMLNEINSRFEY